MANWSKALLICIDKQLVPIGVGSYPTWNLIIYNSQQHYLCSVAAVKGLPVSVVLHQCCVWLTLISRVFFAQHLWRLLHWPSGLRRSYFPLLGGKRRPK